MSQTDNYQEDLLESLQALLPDALDGGDFPDNCTTKTLSAYLLGNDAVRKWYQEASGSKPRAHTDLFNLFDDADLFLLKSNLNDEFGIKFQDGTEDGELDDLDWQARDERDEEIAEFQRQNYHSSNYTNNIAMLCRDISGTSSVMSPQDAKRVYGGLHLGRFLFATAFVQVPFALKLFLDKIPFADSAPPKPASKRKDRTSDEEKQFARRFSTQVKSMFRISDALMPENVRAEVFDLKQKFSFQNIENVKAELSGKTDGGRVSVNEIDAMRTDYKNRAQDLIINYASESMVMLRSLHRKQQKAFKAGKHGENVHYTMQMVDLINKFELFPQVIYDIWDSIHERHKEVTAIRREAVRLLKEHQWDVKLADAFFADKTDGFWQGERDCGLLPGISEEQMCLFNTLESRCAGFADSNGLTVPHFWRLYHKLVYPAYRAVSDNLGEVILRNSRLPIYIAEKQCKNWGLNNTHVPKMDIISEGLVGLIKGAELFDFYANYKLSTYVTWWIKQSINKFFRDNRHVVKMGNVDDIMKYVRTISKDAESRFGHEAGEAYILRHFVLRQMIDDFGKKAPDRNGIRAVLSEVEPHDFCDTRFAEVYDATMRFIEKRLAADHPLQVMFQNALKEGLQEQKRLQGGKKRGAGGRKRKNAEQAVVSASMNAAAVVPFCTLPSKVFLAVCGQKSDKNLMFWQKLLQEQNDAEWSTLHADKGRPGNPLAGLNGDEAQWLSFAKDILDDGWRLYALYAFVAKKTQWLAVLCEGGKPAQKLWQQIKDAAAKDKNMTQAPVLPEKTELSKQFDAWHKLMAGLEVSVRAVFEQSLSEIKADTPAQKAVLSAAWSLLFPQNGQDTSDDLRLLRGMLPTLPINWAHHGALTAAAACARFYERQNLCPPAKTLVWQAMLQIYEQEFGLDAFMQHPYFKEWFEPKAQSKRASGNKTDPVCKIDGVRYAIQAYIAPVSLENEVSGDEEGTTYREMLEGALEPLPDDLVDDDQRNRVIQEICAKRLAPRELTVVMRYHGIGMQSNQSFSELADELDVTVERVRQIYKKALKNLQGDPELQALVEHLSD